MKNFKHLFTALLLMCATMAFAQEVFYSKDGIKYKIDKETKQAKVVADKTKYSGDLVIHETIEFNDVTYYVISIEEDAFYNCSGLTSITIPNSVTSIENYAFSGCSGLKSITIGNSVTSIGSGAFKGCAGLTNIIIPNSVTSIGGSAFKECSSLTSIEIPNSVTSIGDSAFKECSSLTSIEIPNSVTSIGDNAFEATAWYDNQPDGIIYVGKVLHTYKGTMPKNTSIVIKEGTLNIGEYAFSGCDGLTSITIPNSVTSIGEYAFNGCDGLTSITIPNSFTSIGERAFYNCSGLKSITIPNSVTSIEWDAFALCSSLTNITIPNSVTSIGQGVFWKCSGLTSIEIPNSVTSIGVSAFEDCSALKSVTIGNGVISIGQNAFFRCNNLTSVHISDISAWCNIDFNNYSANPLYYAKNLYLNSELITDLVIPDDVTKIKKSAFYYCYKLKSVTIPNSITSIEQDAFAECSGLTAVHISNLSAWCNIDFNNYSANPLYYAKNLYLNGNLITDLVIPNDITEIKKLAFNHCSGLTSVEIPNNITTIESSVFSGCSELERVTIGNSVTSIGNNTFGSCKKLTCITIPNSVTSIGSGAFKECSSLTSIEIPNSVTSIESDAFRYCSGLTNVTIGSGIKKINEYSFANCNNLADVYCLATTVPTTNGYAFSPQNITLHVPAEAINKYKATSPWSKFGTIVAFDGEKCATPVISYDNGKLSISCKTEGAEFTTTVINSYAKTYQTDTFDLAAEYNITVYATATGYENSETVNAILCWIENGENDESNNVINIPATAALVTSSNGVLTISCSLDGEKVAIYTTDGTLIATATIENSFAAVATGLSKGTVAIVKIGEKSVKVAVN